MMTVLVLELDCMESRNQIELNFDSNFDCFHQYCEVVLMMEEVDVLDRCILAALALTDVDVVYMEHASFKGP